MIDGTPVVDIKRYSPGWDDVFAARTSRQLRPLPAPDAELVEILLNEVEHFHGAINAGARRAVRLVTDHVQSVAYPSHRSGADRDRPDA